MTVSTPRQTLGFACLEALAHPATIKDDELRYVWVNSAFADVFGVGGAQVYGHRDDDVFTDGPLLPDPALERRVLTTGKPEDRYETIANAAGLLREVVISAARVDHDGRFHLVQLMHDITEVAAANHSLIEATENLAAESMELRSQAMSDPLTGLLNLRGFEPAAHAAFAESAGKGAIAMLDVDDFKTINDRHGHGVGDEALRMIAHALRESTRSRCDVIGRVGGDEFVIALPGLSTATVDLVTARIRLRIGEISVPADAGSVPVRISLGLALCEQGSHNLDAWRHEADLALYDAKRGGKDRCVVRVVSPASNQRSDSPG